ncbi:MAG: hypothetical protein ACKN97_01445 [Acidobacteriota bacterium]
MKNSIKGIGILCLLVAVIGTGCNPFHRISARRKLVDGATEYKNRKFDKAEELFRSILESEPEVASPEARFAEVFLARTIHMKFMANTKNVELANNAIALYKQAIERNPSDEKSFEAVGGLFKSLKKDDEWKSWYTTRANNEAVPGPQRATALVQLSAERYKCTKEVTDDESIKKKQQENGELVFRFSKPADVAKFEDLKKCTAEGTVLIDRALELQKAAAAETDNAWAYKMNFTIQSMRIADMEGRNDDRLKFKAEADKARQRKEALEAERKAKEEAEEQRKAAEAGVAAEADKKK